MLLSMLCVAQRLSGGRGEGLMQHSPRHIEQRTRTHQAEAAALHVFFLVKRGCLTVFSTSGKMNCDTRLALCIQRTLGPPVCCCALRAARHKAELVRWSPRMTPVRPPNVVKPSMQGAVHAAEHSFPSA